MSAIDQVAKLQDKMRELQEQKARPGFEKFFADEMAGREVDETMMDRRKNEKSILH